MGNPAHALKGGMIMINLLEFDLLKKRDFENGVVLDEIRNVIKERDRLILRVSQLEDGIKRHQKNIWGDQPVMHFEDQKLYYLLPE